MVKEVVAPATTKVAAEVTKEVPAQVTEKVAVPVATEVAAAAIPANDDSSYCFVGMD